MNLADQLAANTAAQQRYDMAWQPEGPLPPDRLAELLTAGVAVADRYETQVEELFRVEHPALRPALPDYFTQLERFRQEQAGGAPWHELGEWWFYPWRRAVVHIMEHAAHTRLRTARNYSLISREEQADFARARVGIAGLSVGSSVFGALIQLGEFAELRLADGDRLDLTNLNRIRGGLADLGVLKAVKAAREATDLDPQARLQLFAEGLTEDNLESFLDGLTVVIDEMDDLRLKTMLRVAARARRLPVVMATDAGNNCILDVERFDLHPDMPVFHGRLSEQEVAELLAPQPNFAHWARLSMKIIGAEHAEPRMLEVLRDLQAGRLAGVPQIGPSAMLSGAVAAFAVRQIIHKRPVRSGKMALDVVNTVIEEAAVLPADGQGGHA